MLIILLLQSATYVTLFFNVPIATQVIGFFYFTFIPGFILVKLWRFDELDWVETVLLSVGFSVAFLMLAGLLINEFGFLLGFSQPLSLMPLIVVLNSIILMGAILVYLRSGEYVKIWKSEHIEKSPFALLFLCLPILSIVGAIYVNVYGNNLLLLFMLIAIPSLFIVGVLSRKLLSSKLYPFAVLMIAIAILCHSSLISNYLVSFGSDIPLEYMAFKNTENNAHWNSSLPLRAGLGLGRVNAMLSITILPAIYSSLLNIDSTWMFKTIFPLLFSLIPLGLYQVWQTFVEKKYAFIAAFLFMAQETFYTEMLGLNRQMVAELFFVLLLYVVLNNKIKPRGKILCFSLFSIGLVTSHYGLAEIFLFVIAFAVIFLFLVKHPSRKLTITFVVLFSVIMFSWYLFTARSTVFDSTLDFGNDVFRQLGDFLSPTARGETVLRGLGLESPPTIWNAISRAFAYAIQFLIVVGFIGLLMKQTKAGFKEEYFAFSFLAMALLAALVLVPGLANTMNMTRFYHILLLLLAPLSVLGADFLVRMVIKRKHELVISVLILSILVPYFLFQTSFVYEVTGGDSWSIPLSRYRISAVRLYGHSGYTDAQSVYGAQWLSKNVHVTYSTLYADGASRINVLSIYGMIYGGGVNELSNVTKVVDNGVIYLSTLSVVEDVILFGQLSWNSSELSFIFDELNLVYSNSGSKIYKHSP